MKKNILALLITIMVCALFVGSCEHTTKDVDHTDPAYLEGTWASAEGNFTFVIDADLTFVCDLNLLDAQITGKLDAEAPNLGKNDYKLTDMEADATDEEHPGNDDAMVQGMLPSMNNIVVTLTPKENFTKFKFTSENQTANGFFGSDGTGANKGVFTKQP